jgi:hypothetical protein
MSWPGKRSPVKIDGFPKSPTSVLRYILRFFKVRKVRIITQDLRALPILWIGGAFFFAIKILLFTSLLKLMAVQKISINKFY